LKNLEGIDLPHEKANIGALDDVVLSLLYDMLLDIANMHQVKSIDCLRHWLHTLYSIVKIQPMKHYTLVS